MEIKPIQFYAEQEYQFAERQVSCSSSLFLSGVVSQVIFGFGEADKETPIEEDEATDPDFTDYNLQCNYHFVPYIDYRPDGDRHYPLLYLATLSKEPSVPSRKPILLGRVDESWSLLHNTENLRDVDMDIVLGFAREFNQARDDGLLPDLRSDLRYIENPYNTIFSGDSDSLATDLV